MIVNSIKDFAQNFDTILSLDENSIIKRENRYYLLTSTIAPFIRPNFTHAGIYLGKNGKDFHPGLNFLSLLAAQSNVNKTIVNEKAAWLFVCGRNILPKSIIRIEGSKTRGSYTLIQNENRETLGYGRFVHNRAINNIADIGDYLRREKPHNLLSMKP